MPKIRYIKVDAQTFNLFCWSTLRYAIGRRSYVVGWACEVLKKYLPVMSHHAIDVMIEDIQKAPDYGMDMDKAEWMHLLQLLRKKHDRFKPHQCQIPRTETSSLHR